MTLIKTQKLSKVIYTRFFLLSHSVLVLAIVTVMGINFFFDTTGFFRLKYKDEIQISQFMNDGSNVIIPPSKIHFNERVLRWFWYKNHDLKKDVLIFGSSRARMLNNSFFDWPQPEVFVDVVNGATLQDFLVFTYLRDKRSGLWPKELVLSIDPHMLSTTNEYADWIEIVYPALYREAVKFYELQNLPKLSNTQFSNFELIQQKNSEENDLRSNLRFFIKYLTSLSSLRANSQRFYSYLKNPINQDKMQPTSEKCTEHLYYTTLDEKFYVFCADGSMPMYTGKTTNEEIAAVDKLILSDPKMPVTKNIDNLAINLLKQLVTLYESKGANVTLLLSPPHPQFYRQSANNSDEMGFIKVEKAVQQFAKDNNLNLIGSYNNAIIKAEKRCFIDWIHPATCALGFIKSELKALGVLGRLEHASNN